MTAGTHASAGSRLDRYLTLSDQADDQDFLVSRPEDLLVRSNTREIDDTQKSEGNNTSEVFSLSSRFPKSLAPPPLPNPSEFFRAFQKWEGCVTEVDNDFFRAILTPLLGDDAEVEAEIYLEDIDPDQRALVQPGAIFYWSIGYLDKSSGQRIQSSILRFRRLPRWTESELRDAEVKAAEWMRLFDDAQSTQSTCH